MTMDATKPQADGAFAHGEMLGLLARAEAGPIKALAEELLPDLGPVEVLSSRTGLAMLPYEDTVRNTTFHLGEVLLAEAHLRLTAFDVEGYGAIVGRDLQRAMGMAVIDASFAAGIGRDAIEAFLTGQRRSQAEADSARLRKVEATRVEMETF